MVLDSLRYDTYLRARTPNLDAIGGPERRFSYASWTAPSHYNMLTGLLPHPSNPGVFANDWYTDEFNRFDRRLGIEAPWAALMPRLWLPSFLKGCGFETHARVSQFVIGPESLVNSDFDTFALVEDAAESVETMDVAGRGFWLMNFGETHYPYNIPGDDPGYWPHLSGVRGAARGDTSGAAFFGVEEMKALHDRQVRALEYLDREVVPALIAKLPPDTWLTVTADHGECFGEGGYFGHGPVMHDKVFEVPLVEGLVA